MQPEPRALSRRQFLQTGAAATVSASVSGQSQRPLNVILFLVDDLGWMDLGCQGSTFYETPHTDRLAAEGVRFTDAYSNCPVCSPSRAALMTGKYPGSVGFTGHITAILRHRYKPHGRVIPPDDYMFLRHSETTLAEALKPAGYASASIGKWHLGSEAYWPEQQGFDLNVGGYDHGSPPSYFDPYTSPDKDWNPDIPTLEDRQPGEYLTDRLTDEAVDFIESRREQSFFLYMTHFAVHTPLEAPADLVRKYEKKLNQDDSQINATYAAMIEKTDDSLGKIVAKLEELGLRENTVILFASDNGGLQEVTRNVPLREGKGFLYEGGIRTPFIVSWLGRIPGGRISEEPVTGADIYPTVAELAGDAAKPGKTDGRSLAALLLDPDSEQAERSLYWYYPHYSPQARRPGAAVRRGRYKLIEHYDPSTVELYDLEADISETRDLSASQPELAAELRADLQRWVDDHVAIPHRLNPDYDPELAKQESPQ